MSIISFRALKKTQTKLIYLLWTALGTTVWSSALSSGAVCSRSRSLGALPQQQPGLAPHSPRPHSSPVLALKCRLLRHPQPGGSGWGCSPRSCRGTVGRRKQGAHCPGPTDRCHTQRHPPGPRQAPAPLHGGHLPVTALLPAAARRCPPRHTLGRKRSSCPGLCGCANRLYL